MIQKENDSPKSQSFFGTYVVMVVLFILVFLSGYNYFYQPFASVQEVNEPQQSVLLEPIPSGVQSENDPVAEIATSLSPSEKISLLLAQPADLSSNDEFVFLNTGFITLFGSSLEKDSTAFFISRLQQQRSSTQLPLGVMVDHEGGTVQRLSGLGFTQLPSWKDVCNLTPEEGAALFAASAEELKEVGITHVLAPMLDVGTSSVLGGRVCSADAATVTGAATSYAEIFLEHSITPVFKHFPGIGSITKDLHSDFDSVTIYEKDTVPFKELLSTFPQSAVMVSHVGVDNQNPQLPCSFSSDCIGELLAVFPNTLRFTDALEMKSSLSQASASATLSELSDASRQALLAGNTVLVFGPTVKNEEIVRVKEELTVLYVSSEHFSKRVDESVNSIITSKIEFY